MIEYLDYVDDHDRVLGRLPKEVVHQRNLTRRIVHIFVFDAYGRMALQLRSAAANYLPLHWVTAASGHVQAGESYEMAAQRETLEELGFVPTLRFIGKELYVGHQRRLHLATFVSRARSPIRPHPEDIERIDFLSLVAVRSLIRQSNRVHPEFAFLFRRHFMMV